MKRGFGEEFALPYPNIRTKEGYVMKKRVLTLALSLVVVVSVSACENSNESKEESSTKSETTETVQKQTQTKTQSTIKTSDFQSGVSKFYIENIYFDIPSNWIHERKEMAWFYPTNNKNLDGFLLVGFEKLNGSITDEKNFESFLNSLGNSSGNSKFEIISSGFEKNKNGTPLAKANLSMVTTNGISYKESVACFDCDGGYVAFLFATINYYKYDFSYDFDCIVDSVSVKDIENNTQQEKNTQTKNITMGQQNALRSALQYLNTMAFSKSGLIDQLEYEGYSTEEATYAVENCGADWNEQAAKSAQNYINTMSFSRSGLIDQLIYEGFTQEQAEYGVSAVGY